MAYSSRANRELLPARGIEAVIPERADEIANRERKGSAGGHPVGDDKGRNVVEPFFDHVKRCHALASRDGRHAVNEAMSSSWPPPTAHAVMRPDLTRQVPAGQAGPADFRKSLATAAGSSPSTSTRALSFVSSSSVSLAEMASNSLSYFAALASYTAVFMVGAML